MMSSEVAMEEFVMSFLDVAPMITALRTRPADFEMDQGSLHHFPSHHRFQFNQDGNVTLNARCDCALLRVKREQSQELWSAFQIWQAAYWRPTEINKEFACHFRSPNMWQRLYRSLRVTVRRALRHNGGSPTRGECHV
jgi:hypothetical protein